MSGDKKKDDEARTFLKDFLTQLSRSDQTNREKLQVEREQLQAQRELLQVQRLLFQQNNQLIQALSTMSAQLDGMAQRSDYLYDQMGRLGQILVNDGSAIAMDPFPVTQESVARDLGRGVVDGFVKSFFPGQGRGGRSRRR